MTSAKRFALKQVSKLSKESGSILEATYGIYVKLMCYLFFFLTTSTFYI